jgi:hypothetical protein
VSSSSPLAANGGILGQPRSHPADTAAHPQAFPEVGVSTSFPPGETRIALHVHRQADGSHLSACYVKEHEVRDAIDEGVHFDRSASRSTAHADIEAERPLDPQVRIADFEGTVPSVWAKVVQLLEGGCAR